MTIVKVSMGISSRDAAVCALPDAAVAIAADSKQVPQPLEHILVREKPWLGHTRADQGEQSAVPTHTSSIWPHSRRLHTHGRKHRRAGRQKYPSTCVDLRA
mmetsp:Transcript_36627/g.104918  ORF Transcript_36627/g.104918 Transcript_36627/m.104918 type:complete len:101 (-) Transcript_36627:20-322(-)